MSSSRFRKQQSKHGSMNPYTFQVSSAVIIFGFAFAVGLIFGSFLNVVITRLPAAESIVAPGSKCEGCSAPVRWYDNVPLLSFAILRGRCRDCGAAISWRYPLVEIATGAWFALSASTLVRNLPADGDRLLQAGVTCLAVATLGWLLIGLAVIDWRYHLLPNELTIGGLLAGMLFACTQALFLQDAQADVVLQHPIHLNSANAGRSTGNVFLTGPEHVIFGRLFAAVAAFLLLYGVRLAYRVLRKREGLGLGDAKLLALIAAFLGLEPAAVAMAAGILLATGYAVWLLFRRRATISTALPFGTFLAVGGLMAALYGQRVADLYLGLFR